LTIDEKGKKEKREKTENEKNQSPKTVWLIDINLDLPTKFLTLLCIGLHALVKWLRSATRSWYHL
jgi:hypothetical protein